MPEDNPSILSHVSLGTNDFTRAVAFYDRVLPTLGCRRIMEHPGAVAWGKAYPEFWVQVPIDGRPAGVGNGSHVGLLGAFMRDPDGHKIEAMVWEVADVAKTS
jgi:catechol 2,3-dioxygenase-like lactoylglutathione lyase family enzyme